jgi:hypothetical protein
MNSKGGLRIMITRLHCPNCKPPDQLDSEDQAAGYLQRVVYIERVKTPDDHRTTITNLDTGEVVHTSQIPFCVCDACNAEIPDGTPAWAWTMWHRSEKPTDWEKEFTQ